MYSQIFELHADLLKAISHPRRLEILHLLRDQELCVSDIYEMLDLPQANISQHLMIMRDAGILDTKRDGKQIIYKITNPKILQACDLLREVLIETYEDTEMAKHLHMEMKELVPIVHDPVCQMRVSPRTAAAASKYKGQKYFFCASGCLKKFEANQEKYVR